MKSFLLSATLVILALSAFAQDTNLRPDDVQAAVETIDLNPALDTIGIDDLAIVVADEGEWAGEYTEEWNLNEEDTLSVAVDPIAVADTLTQAAETIRTDPQAAVDAVNNALSDNSALSGTVAELASTIGMSQEDLVTLAQQNQDAINEAVATIANSASQDTLEGQNTDQLIQTVTENLSALGIQLNAQG